MIGQGSVVRGCQLSKLRGLRDKEVWGAVVSKLVKIVIFINPTRDI